MASSQCMALPTNNKSERIRGINMKSVFNKYLTYCKLHAFLTILFLFLLFAAHWIPEERILAHSTSFLPHNPEYSTLWNSLLGQDSGYRWNGIQALFRPLLYLFGPAQIRYLCMIAFFLLLFGAALQISRKLSPPFGFLLLFSFLWADILPVSYSLLQAGCFLITFAAILFLLGKTSLYEREDPNFLYLTFYAIGAVTVFLDSGTIPVLTLGIPLTIAFLSIRKFSNSTDIRKKLIFCSFFWGLGCLFMTVTKWLFTVLATGKNLFPEYLKRLWDENFGAVHSLPQFFLSLYNNLREFLSRPDFGIKTLAILLLILTAAYLTFFIMGHRIKRACLALLPLAFISLLPLLFYLFAPARGLTRPVLTSRALIASMYPILLLLHGMLDTERISHKLHTAMKSLWRN